MIKITKPAQAPEILRVQGVRRTRTICTDFEAHESEYRTGTLTFTFDPAIYAHGTVKDVLVFSQHKKGCFCESKIGSDGDVEHFRPKAGYRQTKSGALLRPGYYWLAYEWSNLLLSCGPCNQRFKKNLFPLVAGSVRAECHRDDLARETTLFINPSIEDPQAYISFRKEIAFPINGNAKGKATIESLGLNREIMREIRHDRLKMLIFLRTVVDLEDRLSEANAAKVIARAKRFLTQAVTEQAEYAGMARAAQAKDFRL